MIGGVSKYFNDRGKPTLIDITELDFEDIITIKSNVMRYYYAFNPNITSVKFTKLKTVESYGLFKAFYNSGVSSVTFPKLEVIGDYGLNNAFTACGPIEIVNFPCLRSIGTEGLAEAFKYCNSITGIHFKAAYKSTIEATSGYSNKFGASNAAIYFDL